MKETINRTMFEVLDLIQVKSTGLKGMHFSGTIPTTWIEGAGIRVNIEIVPGQPYDVQHALNELYEKLQALPDAATPL